MAKLASYVFASDPLPDPTVLKTPTVCLLCGTALLHSAYPAPDWGSVSKWDLYVGRTETHLQLRWLCADCTRLVNRFQRHQFHTYDELTGERHRHPVIAESAGAGWHRWIVDPSSPTRLEIEHYRWTDLKGTPPTLPDKVPYWSRLHAAIFDERAHIWVMFDSGMNKARSNLFPALPYTPAGSPILHLLSNCGAVPVIVHVRRTVLWDTLVAASHQRSALSQISDQDLGHLINACLPTTPWTDEPSAT